MKQTTSPARRKYMFAWISPKHFFAIPNHPAIAALPNEVYSHQESRMLPFVRFNWLLLVATTFALLFAGGAATVRGQSALDAFDPHANNLVRVIVVQSDQKILIGGDFTTLSPNGGMAVTRNHIARLNPDGTLDTTFDPNATNFVSAIAVQSDGKILVGGGFSGANSIGGQPRNFIARLDATTGAADSFNPNANNQVRAIAVQTDGKILAGGDFNATISTPTIGGQTRNHVARLDATTGLADGFDPDTNGNVFAIKVQSDGKILIGGGFTLVFNFLDARNDIARFNTDDTLDMAFDPDASANNHVVRAFAIQSDNKILAVGDFTIMSGQTRNQVARLDGTTGLADSFDPNANDDLCFSVALHTSGKILVGGGFLGANSIGGQARNRIARLDPATGLADSFDPNANDFVLSIAVQADNKILVGGSFTTLAPNGAAPVNRNFIARLEDVGPSAADGNVRGHIVDNNGNPVEGAVVQLSGTQNRKFITDRNGNYHFDNVETNGFYTVKPSRANLTFSPSQRSFSALGQHTDAAFTAAANGGALNPSDTSEYFVRQQYLDFLGREPDEAGFNFWVNNIEGCGADFNCRAVKRIDTSAAFFLSIEFQQTGYLVYRIYQAAYGDMPNTPVPIKLSEFGPDTAEIGRGVIVNQNGWQTVLEDNKQAFVAEFAQRSTFVSAYPTTMTPDQFVDRLFANTGVTPSASDRMAAVNEFGPAISTLDVAARGRALRRVAENSVLARQEFNQAFVLMQYFGYLRRDANSGPDADFTGYNFWLEKLNRFGGNYQNAEMVEAFLTSGEYRGRFPR